MANTVTNHDLSFDETLLLAEDQTVSSGSEQGEVSSVDVELDLGAFDGNMEKYVAVMNIGAIDNAQDDETYVVAIQSSDDNTFAVLDATFIITLDHDESDRQYIWPVAKLGQFMRALITVGGSSPSVVINDLFITRIP